jgi:hypothetical protein
MRGPTPSVLPQKRAERGRCAPDRARRRKSAHHRLARTPRFDCLGLVSFRRANSCSNRGPCRSVRLTGRLAYVAASACLGLLAMVKKFGEQPLDEHVPLLCQHLAGHQRVLLGEAAAS